MTTCYRFDPVQRPLLLVDPEPNDALLHHDGQPVWPAYSAADLEALQRVSALFGGDLKQVRGTRGEVSPGTETVVALSDEVEKEARLYAHLTGRRLRRARRIDKRAPSAVVVITLEQLTAGLLERLYAPDRARSVPGLLCATPGRVLHEQILVRAAAAALSGPLDGATEIAFFGWHEFPRRDAGERQVWGPSWSKEQVREALGAGAGVLSISTHTDGIDAYLGPVTLCPLVRGVPPGAAGTPPRCQTTGLCHRTLLPVAAAMTEGKLFASDDISARILIFDGCNSLQVMGSPLADSRWTLGPFLFASPGLGAVAATWNLSLTDVFKVSELSTALVSGMTIGEALARFNRSRVARQKGHQFCLIGDPRVRLPTRVKRPPDRRRHRPVKGNLATSADIARVSLLRVAIDPMRSRPLGEQWEAARGAAAGVTAAVDAYEHAAWKRRPVEGAPDVAGPKLRAALLEFLARKISTVTLFQALISDTRSLPAEACPACGEVTLGSVFRFAHAAIEKRHMYRCPIHATVRDVPAGVNVTGVLRGDTFELAGKLPAERWMGKLIIETRIPSENRAVDWPAGVGGAPAPRVRLPRPWPAGGLYVGVALAWGTHYLLVGQAAAGG